MEGKTRGIRDRVVYPEHFISISFLSHAHMDNINSWYYRPLVAIWRELRGKVNKTFDVFLCSVCFLPIYKHLSTKWCSKAPTKKIYQYKWNSTFQLILIYIMCLSLVILLFLIWKLVCFWTLKEKKETTQKQLSNYKQMQDAWFLKGTDVIEWSTTSGDQLQFFKFPITFSIWYLR